MTIGDFTTVNGSNSAFNAVSSTVYTILVTPTTDGAVTVDVNAATALDLAGNPNTASNTLSRTYDATQPSVVLSSSAPSTITGSFTVLATFSESVTGFTGTDIT